MRKVLALLFCFVGSLSADTFPLTCSSENGKFKHCDVDTSQGVKLDTKWIGEDCVPRYSWGYDETGVWVDHGCSALFKKGNGKASYILQRSSRRRSSDSDNDADSSKPPCDATNSKGLDKNGNWYGPDCTTVDPLAKTKKKNK